MEAYDFKNLVERLKSRGLSVTEELARGAVHDVIAWLSDSAKASSTPFDDIVLPFLPAVEEGLDKEIDKIDGKVG